MGLFKKKKPTELATISLNMRLQPEDRVTYYEEMLEKLFKSRKFGEIDGGGTSFTKEEGPLSCDVNFIYYKDKEEEIIEVLKKMPAPKGSKVLLGEEGDREYEIGDLEGLALYLNGTELEKEVYESCDINYVVSELMKLMGKDVAIFSYWTGNKEMALYFYGENFERMKSAIQPFVDSYPLCQKSRIEQLA